METEIGYLSSTLFDALQAFDVSNVPLGLYTMNANFKGRHANYVYEMEKRVLWPVLVENYCFPRYERNSIGFELPDSQRGTLTVERVSLIKVNHFGNAYQVDKNIDSQRRWNELDLAKRIKQLARSASVTTGVQMLMLVGFDKGPNPLGAEIRQFQEEMRTYLEDLAYFDRTWADASQRGFNIRACIWAKLHTTT